jgi:hypothetical protein
LKTDTKVASKNASTKSSVYLCSGDFSGSIDSTQGVANNHFINVKHCVADVNRVWITQSIAVITRTIFIPK